MSENKSKRISAILKLAFVLLVGGSLYCLNHALNYEPETTAPDLHTATINAIKATNAMKSAAPQR
jgi:hypothetical protein